MTGHLNHYAIGHIVYFYITKVINQANLTGNLVDTHLQGYRIPQREPNYICRFVSAMKQPHYPAHIVHKRISTENENKKY